MLSARLGTIAIACLLTLGAATGTLGCKKLLRGSKDKTAGTTTSTASTNTPQDDVDEQMLDKLDAYIICLNTLSSPVHATRARYFSWVDPKKGVTGNERVVAIAGAFLRTGEAVQVAPGAVAGGGGRGVDAGGKRNAAASGANAVVSAP